MKKNLKKGFTLTELVVVIVIIGILASVLIPTLTSYITRSRKSAAEQEATAHLQELSAYVLEASNEDWFTLNEFIKVSTIAVQSGDYWVFFKEGQLQLDDTTKFTDPTADPAGAGAKLVLSSNDSVYTLTALTGVLGDFDGSDHTDALTENAVKLVVTIGSSVTVEAFVS